MIDDKEIAKREKRILTHALWTYGKEVQTWKFIEELGELITAIARMRISEIKPEVARGGELENLIEEVADSTIVGEQIITCYGVDKRVKSQRTSKLRRLAERLGINAENEKQKE